MKLSCLLLLLLLSVTVKAQDTVALMKKVSKFATASFDGDTKTMLDLSYPGLIELSGGREAMGKMITDRIAQLKGRGVLKFEGWVNVSTRFYKAGNQIHCLFPETVVMKMINGRYISHSYILAISDDQGKNWTFMDVGNMPESVLQRLLPNFNHDLQIPAPTKPTFFPNPTD